MLPLAAELTEQGQEVHLLSLTGLFCKLQDHINLHLASTTHIRASGQQFELAIHSPYPLCLALTIDHMLLLQAMVKPPFVGFESLSGWAQGPTSSSRL